MYLPTLSCPSPDKFTATLIENLEIQSSVLSGLPHMQSICVESYIIPLHPQICISFHPLIGTTLSALLD